MIQHLSSRQMSVGTAAASICEGYVAGTEVHLHALSNNSKDVLVGSSNLTLNNGFVLRKGEHITIRLMERYGMPVSLESFFMFPVRRCRRSSSLS